MKHSKCIVTNLAFNNMSSICVLAPNIARSLTAKSDLDPTLPARNAPKPRRDAATVATTEHSGRESGNTDAGRRFAAVGDRPSIKVG